MSAKAVVTGSGRRRAALLRFHEHDADARREASALAAAGLDVDIVMLRVEGEPAVRRIAGAVAGERGSVTVRRMPIEKRRGSPLRYLWEYSHWFARCALWLWREQRTRPFDVIQVSSLPDHQVFAALPQKWAGARLVLFLKEPTAQLFSTIYGSRRLGAVMGWIARRSIARADVAICVTEQHRLDYIAQGVPADRLSVVLNSMLPFPERPRSRQVDDGRFVLLSHGTIEERWGHDTMLEAVALARSRVPGLELHITGTGTDADRICSRAVELGIDDVVTMHGWVEETALAQLLADADAGIVAQLSNPYSNLVHTGKMFDFIQADVPVIASRLDATHALLPVELEYYEAGDAPDLARVIEAMSASPDARTKLARAARERLVDIGVDAQMRRYAEVVLGDTS